jgi:hypothetical protein
LTGEAPVVAAALAMALQAMRGGHRATSTRSDQVRSGIARFCYVARVYKRG